MISRHLLTASIGALLMVLTCTALAQPDGSSGAQSSISTKDSQFLQQATTTGLTEVQMGQMALDKSSDAQIKQLAQSIIDDQTHANDQLKTLAAQKQVTLPTTGTSDAQKETKSLQAKNGSAFDQAWSKAIVKDHQAAVKLFTKESTQTKDADLKKFAQATLPTLTTNLQAAQKLAAMPDARDKAMDQAMKSMASDPTSDIPATTTSPAPSPAVPAPAPAVKH